MVRAPKRGVEDVRLIRVSKIALAFPETSRQVHGSHAAERVNSGDKLCALAKFR